MNQPLPQEPYAHALLPQNQRTATAKVDWDSVLDLGKVKDSVLAKRYGVSQTAVMLVRRRRGIPPLCTTPRYNIDWDTVPLGKYIDQHLADMLGCGKVLVFKERRRRGIPPHGMLYRTIENEGAYYEEAIIDAWLHMQQVPHKFQAKVGPYRVDWLLDNQEIWEFLGMWDHQIYGESYRKNFAVKRAYLLAQGFRLREIHRTEVKSFKQVVDLRSIFSLGDFTCRGCLQTDVKHHAHAMCSSCVGQKFRGVEPGTPKKARLRKSDAFECSECKSTNRKKQVRGRCAKCALTLYKVTSSSKSLL